MLLLGLVHQAAINGCLKRGQSKHHTPVEELWNSPNPAWLMSFVQMRFPYLISLPSAINYSSCSYPCTLPWFVLSQISPPLLAFYFMRQKALILSSYWLQGSSPCFTASSGVPTTESKDYCSLSSPFSLFCDSQYIHPKVSIISAGLQGEGRCWDLVFLLIA